MGNTALITGSSSGIGAELARYHASKGGDTVLVARTEDKLETLKLELEKNMGLKPWLLQLTWPCLMLQKKFIR